MFIREGVIEGEKHYSQSGRKFEMVRRDQLKLVRAGINGTIDMKSAGTLLGLSKSRMRQILQMLFPQAKKVGSAATSAWCLPRTEIETIVALAADIPRVAIPDEGDV